MDTMMECPVAATLARRLREARFDLTKRWLDRISARVSIDPNRVFPTEDLLNHMPLLLLGIADYLEDPARVVSGEISVSAKAMELGALRYAQGFDEYEILKEFELFGGILFSFIASTANTLDESCTPQELLLCAQRLFHAITLIQQASLTHYLQLLKERVGEREERLRSFNRALTHELKNQLGAALGAAQLLEGGTHAEGKQHELNSIVLRNVTRMRTVLDNLLELTHLDPNSRQQRHVKLEQAISEVVRQLRDKAKAAAIQIRTKGDIPPVEVPAAVVELSLTNYISNAIKYADSKKAGRWIEIRSYTRDASAKNSDSELVVEVYDNGLGVPTDERTRLFERFFRTSEATVSGAEGSGLGLSIVRETIESLGGRVWAEFPEAGSIFAFAIPSRRAADLGPEDSSLESNA